MGAKAADKIHTDGEIDKLKKDLAKATKDAAEEKDEQKKKKLIAANGAAQDYLDGLVEAEGAVREVGPIHSAELVAIRAKMAAEAKIVEAAEKTLQTAKNQGNSAGAAAAQATIDAEERKMAGKRKALEIIS